MLLPCCSHFYLSGGIGICALDCSEDWCGDVDERKLCRTEVPLSEQEKSIVSVAPSFLTRVALSLEESTVVAQFLMFRFL